MSEHRVAFHIDDRTVVCTCGEHFTTPPSMFGFMTAVTLWADHLRRTSGLNLGDAYEAGWADACGDHLRQREDPAYPIGSGKRDRYPDPTTIAQRREPTGAAS